ncbi:MAG: HEAT repeat domain-containing protein [Candidatus Omnitrophica bacterium]|nr:HEAT repeat domain-containing protein [Candidatus Omnitrophota bacterium]MBU1997375.1 HEAT repeat domain-containing protein [Candidatus Omnitrophota bacterium]
MRQVNTTCQKCGFNFQWCMGEGLEVPDCPECGFNPISSQRDSGVDKLLADLNSSDANTRNNAAVFLGQKGEKRACEPLLKIFKKERANVPPGVLVALGELKEERAIGLILELIPDSDLDSNAHMLGLGTKALAKIGTKEVLEVVMKNLRYLCVPWPIEVKEAIKAFIGIGSDAVPILLDGLTYYKNAGSCSVPVRKEIIWALGEIGGEQAISAIKPFLSDNNSELAQAAKEALVLLKGKPETQEEEILFLIQHGHFDAIKTMGQDAIKPVVKLLMSAASQKAKKDIAVLLDEMDWLPSNDVEKMEYLIAKQQLDTLAAMGTCAKEVMVNAMNDDDYEGRLQIPEALIKLNDPGIFDVLLKAFKQGNCWDLSRAAAKALGLLGDKRAIEHLTKDLKTAWVDEQLGCECAHALGELSDRSSIEILEYVANKEGQYDSLRDAALKAIEKIEKAQ